MYCSSLFAWINPLISNITCGTQVYQYQFYDRSCCFFFFSILIDCGTLHTVWQCVIYSLGKHLSCTAVMYPFTVRCILQFVLMALSAQVALTTSLTSLFNESLVAAANFSRRKLISLPLSLPHITHELKNKWTNLHVRDASGFLHTCMCKDTHAENKLKIKIIFTNAEVSLPTHSSTEQHRPLQVYVPSASLFHIVFSCTVWWLIFLSHVSLTLYSYVK